MSAAFSAQQQEYLKGFMFGVEAPRAAFGMPLASQGGLAGTDPNDLQRAAQDRTVAAGGTLVAEEEAKRKKPPLLRFDEISALAKARQFPKGADVFLRKYFGMFYVAPAQNAFMCRPMCGGDATAMVSAAASLGCALQAGPTLANIQTSHSGCRRTRAHR